MCHCKTTTVRRAVVLTLPLRWLLTRRNRPEAHFSYNTHVKLNTLTLRKLLLSALYPHRWQLGRNSSSEPCAANNPSADLGALTKDRLDHTARNRLVSYTQRLFSSNSAAGWAKEETTRSHQTQAIWCLARAKRELRAIIGPK